MANSWGDKAYLDLCKARGIKPHPCRYPIELPELFIRLLTDAGDLVADPFAGSCVSGEAAEKLGRGWLCCEQRAEYCEGGKLRFDPQYKRKPSAAASYVIKHPAGWWSQGETTAESGVEEEGKAA